MYSAKSLSPELRCRISAHSLGSMPLVLALLAKPGDLLLLLLACFGSKSLALGALENFFGNFSISSLALSWVMYLKLSNVIPGLSHRFLRSSAIIAVATVNECHCDCKVILLKSTEVGNQQD